MSKELLKEAVFQQAKAMGGLTNAHSHLDRAYTITAETLPLADAPLQEKWDLVDTIKRESTRDQILGRMSHATEVMIAQGVATIGSFIDVDEAIGDKAVWAAQRLRERYPEVTFVFANQVLKGVLDPNAREWFERGLQFVDIIGGLPDKDERFHKDKGGASAHLDYILGRGKETGKLVHVHVDQGNTSREKETELLADKVVEHGMHGRVVAIHSISIGAHPKEYREQVYRKALEAGLSFISCPTAWIDSRRSEELAPTHNSITPADELLQRRMLVAIGTDNIADLYLPATEGDMWEEIKLLLRTNRIYNPEVLARIASINGRTVLGVKEAGTFQNGKTNLNMNGTAIVAA